MEGEGIHPEGTIENEKFKSENLKSRIRIFIEREFEIKSTE